MAGKSYEDKDFELKSNNRDYPQIDIYNFVRWRKYRGKPHFSQSTITKFFRALHKKVWNKMIKERWFYDTIIGTFYIKHSKAKKKSYKSGKVKYIFDIRTGGAKPYVKWKKRTGRSRNIRNYIFRCVAGNKKEITGYRGLWHYIKSRAGDYVGNYI